MLSRYARPMRDGAAVDRMAMGAACAIFDDHGRVLLVHHTYGRLNWELPGGGSEPGETPDETATRELLEETGLRAELDQLSGVYFEPEHDLGPMVHFVFRCTWHDRLKPRASSPEADEVGFWALANLPRPMSDFTERRIQDAAAEGPAIIGRVVHRRWLD
jgi:8-oxo-dGTP pyrophosphatase MutT (NUDIX family)